MGWAGRTDDRAHNCWWIPPYAQNLAQAENPARDKPLAAWLAVQLRAANQADHKR